MMSSSKVGRSAAAVVEWGPAVDVDEGFRRWVVASDLDGRREEVCLVEDRDLLLSSARRLSLRLLLSRLWPASTARGPWLSRRYDLCVESDMFAVEWVSLM